MGEERWLRQSLDRHLGSLVRELVRRGKFTLILLSTPYYSSQRTDMPAEQSSRIVVDPEVHFGKPCVAGTRIPVRDVLELVQEGLSFESITTDYYPDLDEADVKACVQYAIDTIDAEEAHILISSTDSLDQS